MDALNDLNPVDDLNPVTLNTPPPAIRFRLLRPGVACAFVAPRAGGSPRVAPAPGGSPRVALGRLRGGAVTCDEGLVLWGFCLGMNSQKWEYAWDKKVY